MRYEVNKDRILEILKPYDCMLTFENYQLKRGNELIMNFAENQTILNIEQKRTSKYWNFDYNFTVEKLHEHFNECFTESSNVSEEKTIDFLRELGFKVENGCVYVHTTRENGLELNNVEIELSDIIYSLNTMDIELCSNEDVIHTLLFNNIDKLREG